MTPEKQKRLEQMEFCVNNIVEFALQSARIRLMNCYIDRDGSVVLFSGDARNQSEAFDMKLRNEAELLLSLMTRELPEITFAENKEE